MTLLTDDHLTSLVTALLPFREAARIEADDDRSVGEDPREAWRLVRDIDTMIGACAMRIGNPA